MDVFEEVKKAIGKKAASLVENDMIVGLGTGSTASFAINEIIQRVENGLKVSVVATSSMSKKMALQGKLTVLDINELSSIDMTLDGADEIDPKGQMIKGAGGALFREKIIASMSKKVVILVDESKLVRVLGEKKPLPLEVLPFGRKWIQMQIEKLGFFGQWRKHDGDFYITDNGNLIYDVQLRSKDVKKEVSKLTNIPGVVETGLFLNLANELILGTKEGKIEHRKL